MKNLVLRFWRNQTGATAIEYGLIAAGISIAIIAAVNGLAFGLCLFIDPVVAHRAGLARRTAAAGTQAKSRGKFLGR